MIIDLQGWGGIHNHFSPGSTASLCTVTFTKKVRLKNEGKYNFPKSDSLNIIKQFKSLGFLLW